jgi:hypothetical protein
MRSAVGGAATLLVVATVPVLSPWRGVYENWSSSDHGDPTAAHQAGSLLDGGGSGGRRVVQVHAVLGHVGAVALARRTGATARRP